MKDRTVRAVAGALAAILTWTPVAHAGSLQNELNSMFNDMGTMSNYTAPGAFRGQAMNTYTGGGLSVRIPNKRYQLFAYEMPSIHAGCNGIDINGGSLSVINSAQFEDILKNFKSSLRGVAYQLALKAVSPLFAGVTEYFKDLDTKMSVSSKSSCELANMAFKTLGDRTNYHVENACQDIAMALGAMSRIEAQEKCKSLSDQNDMLAQAKSSDKPEIASLPPFSGNLTWAALKKGDNAKLDDDDRELVMSMVGTVIYDERGNAKQTYQPTITNANQILKGDEPVGDGSDKVYLTLLHCQDREKCETVTEQKVPVVALSQKVRDLMNSIVQHIRDANAFANPSDEVAFVNMVSEPVYRMLAIGTSFKQDDQVMGLINKYGDVIAADFAYNLLSRTVRVGIYALSVNSKLNPAQVKDASNLQMVAQGLLSVLAQEKNTLYARITSVESMTRELERLQVSVRTNSAAKVLHLFGEQQRLPN